MATDTLFGLVFLILAQKELYYYSRFSRKSKKTTQKLSFYCNIPSCKISEVFYYISVLKYNYIVKNEPFLFT